jgi:hypothetical protein
LFYEFLKFKKIIDQIKKEEEIIEYYKEYSDNFYTAVENIILSEMDLIEESFKSHYNKLDNVSISIQQDYDKYIS